jgi:hypothetical protein
VQRAFGTGEAALSLDVAQKLIDSHLVDGQMVPGTNIGIKVARS